MAHIPSPSMTEWNGNNEWWQGSYEVQRSVACSSFSCDPKASAAPAGPFPASTAALPPPGHGGLAAPSTVASCMAVDGRSTPTSTRSGSSSPAPHQQAARGREGAQPCRQQGHHSSSPGAKPTAPWFEFLVSGLCVLLHGHSSWNFHAGKQLHGCWCWHMSLSSI